MELPPLLLYSLIPFMHIVFWMAVSIFMVGLIKKLRSKQQGHNTIKLRAIFIYFLIAHYVSQSFFAAVSVACM